MPGSFRNYGKIDPYVQFQHETRQKERRRIIVIVAASVFLAVAIICLAVGIAVRRKHASSVSSSSSSNDGPQFSTGSAAIQAACNTTLYPDTCTQTLSDYPGALTANPLQLVTIAVKVALQKATEAYDLSLTLVEQSGLNALETMALEDCAELLENSIDHLNASIQELSGLDVRSLQSSLQEVEVVLSTASSEQTACSDNFDNITGSSTPSMLLKQESVNEVILNALCLVETLSTLGSDISSWKSALPSIPDVFGHLRRRLLSATENDDNDSGSLADWSSTAAYRELLEASSAPDLIVAKDGSGTYTELKEALQNVPKSYAGRYVIYVKAGTYDEGPLNISRSLVNLTLIGDGCNQTIISGSANVAGGKYTTYRSATLGIAATGFVAKNITFRNLAGPDGHQAVAMRTNAENFVFDGCCFEGYQDTLYALSGKQFYRDCKILGTVDFIFGNALAVFQNCDLVARRPGVGQQNTYTAQGRKENVLKTGFSFQNCNLTEGEDLKTSPFNVTTYYGRPWKAHSTTVFLQSYIGSHVSPAGWLSWNASNPFQSTCYYAEYSNTGPGSDTSNRVNWTCVHPDISPSDASAFTVSSFFSDDSFIPSDVSVTTAL